MQRANEVAAEMARVKDREKERRRNEKGKGKREGGK